MNRIPAEGEKKVIHALDQLARVLNDELALRDWQALSPGFGMGYSLDQSDAQFHLRALYRIFGCNVEIEASDG